MEDKYLIVWIQKAKGDMDSCQGYFPLVLAEMYPRTEMYVQGVSIR